MVAIHCEPFIWGSNPPSRESNEPLLSIDHF